MSKLKDLVSDLEDLIDRVIEEAKEEGIREGEGNCSDCEDAYDEGFAAGKEKGLKEGKDEA